MIYAIVLPLALTLLAWSLRARFRPWMVFLGMPPALAAVILFAREPARLLWDGADPLFLGMEVTGLAGLALQVLLLRRCLAEPGAAQGGYRHLLDFPALIAWHPAVKAAAAGLILLPLAWWLKGYWWILDFKTSFWILVRQMSDIQAAFDTLGVVYQFALTAGVPLLFAFHLLSRWRPKGRVLLWLLLGLFFPITVLLVMILVTIAHFAH